MRSSFCEVVFFLSGCLPVRSSSCEGAIRSVRSVFCWKINFHGWVGGGWLDQLKIRLTSAELARLGLSLAMRLFYSPRGFKIMNHGNLKHRFVYKNYSLAL